jgi:hypothetical protein
MARQSFKGGRPLVVLWSYARRKALTYRIGYCMLKRASEDPWRDFHWLAQLAFCFSGAGSGEDMQLLLLDDTLNRVAVFIRF